MLSNKVAAHGFQNLNKNKTTFKIQFLIHTSHISSAQHHLFLWMLSGRGVTHARVGSHGVSSPIWEMDENQ